MTVALRLLAVQGVVGAFDTLWYHEWRARLPARAAQAAPELRLHALRDALYAVIFGTLPWLAWQGRWALAFVTVLVAEITLTMADFVVEIGVRRPIGDVYAGEQVTHAIMGIVYGAMLASLVPVLGDWWSSPTGFVRVDPPIPEALRWLLVAMAAGVLLSGVRDLYAALGLSHGGWPWRVPVMHDA
jgi:hypothetical protein